MVKFAAQKRNEEARKPLTATAVTAGKAKSANDRLHQQLFRRAELVGKFPNIRHLPAPVALHKLTEDDRRRLLAAMALV